MPNLLLAFPASADLSGDFPPFNSPLPKNASSISFPAGLSFCTRQLRTSRVNHPQSWYSQFSTLNSEPKGSPLEERALFSSAPPDRPAPKLRTPVLLLLVILLLISPFN